MPDDNVKFDLKTDPAFIEQQRAITGLVTLLRQQAGTMQAMRTSIETLAQGNNKNKEDNNDDDDKGEDKDINELSNKDFFEFMMKQVGGILDTKFKGMEDKLDGSVKEFRVNRLSDEAEAFAETHKDFPEWGEEMGAMAKKHPTLNIPQLYKLVRDENPDKAKELDAKHKEPEKPVEELSLFGGFRPLKQADGGNGKEEKKLTIDEALDKGWNEMVAKFPALGKSEDVMD